MGLVVDSSVFIAAERRKESVVELLDRLAEVLGDQTAVLSAVTASELIHGAFRTRTRAARREFTEEVFDRLTTEPFTLSTARIAGQIDSEMRARGNTIPPLELQNAVATHNEVHFARMPGLRVLRFD